MYIKYGMFELDDDIMEKNKIKNIYNTLLYIYNIENPKNVCLKISHNKKTFNVIILGDGFIDKKYIHDNTSDYENLTLQLPITKQINDVSVASFILSKETAEIYEKAFNKINNKLENYIESSTNLIFSCFPGR